MTFLCHQEHSALMSERSQGAGEEMQLSLCHPDPGSTCVYWAGTPRTKQ